VTQSVFKCPYCQFEIPSTATVCGYCTKDLAIVKPFMSSMDDISRELGKLKTELSELRSEFKNASATVHLINAGSSVAQNLVDLDEPVYKLTGQSSILFFLLSLFFCAATLDLLHWILLFVYDTNLLALRIITVVVPILISIFVFRKIQIHWLISSIGSLILGSISVFGMLAITSFIDGVPLIPDSTREWREVLEYGFAIACSFVTGLLIENWRAAHQASLRKNITLSLLIERDEQGKFKAPEWTEKIESLFTAAAPFISAGTAIVSGVRVFMG